MFIVHIYSIFSYMIWKRSSSNYIKCLGVFHFSSLVKYLYRGLSSRTIPSPHMNPN